jgi:hypothetical protein
MRWYLSVVLMSIFPLVNNDEHYCMLISYLYILLGEMSIQVLSPFLNQVVWFFYLLSFRSSLNFLDIILYPIYNFQIFCTIIWVFICCVYNCCNCSFLHISSLSDCIFLSNFCQLFPSVHILFCYIELFACIVIWPVFFIHLYVFLNLSQISYLLLL